MEGIGITRALDDLGRIVLPKEFKRSMGINPKDYLEIFVEDDTIVLKKYSNKCEFCGNDTDNIVFKDKLVCKDCIKELSCIDSEKEDN